jgi:hypothetical protein
VGADGTSFRVDGEYLEIDPPRLLVHTWTPSLSELSRTVVRWELQPRPVHNLQAKSSQGGHRHDRQTAAHRICRQRESCRRARRGLEARSGLDAGLRGDRRHRRHAPAALSTERALSSARPGGSPAGVSPAVRGKMLRQLSLRIRSAYFTPFSGSHEPCSLRTKTIWPM